MQRVKFILIKLRFNLLSLLWVMFGFLSFKHEMKKKHIYGTRIYRLSLWTTEVRFFTGKKGGDDVFIKIYKSKNKNIREAQILLQIHSERPCFYVPKLLEYNISDDGLILIIERIDGVTLVNVMNDLSFNLFNMILDQFIWILEDLNNKAIVHCDIKPDNIFLYSINKIKIIDFEYAVCKKNNDIKDLRFENELRLKNLGAKYCKGEFIWDDAYSFYKIACEIISINNYSESELVTLLDKAYVIKMCIGRNQYAY